MTEYALKTYVTTAVSTKQATLSNGTAATNSKAILSGSTIKNSVPGTGISLTSDANNITVTGVDAYDKPNIDSKLSTINANTTNKQATLNNGATVENSRTILFGNIIKKKHSTRCKYKFIIR